MRLPKGITKDRIDANEPLLLYPGEIEAREKHIFYYGKPAAKHTMILASFDRGKLLKAIPENGKVDLHVTGWLKTGQYFYGTDTVRIIHPRRHYHRR